MKKLVFRIPSTALLAAGLIAICVTPVAWVAPGLQALYLVPLGYAYWVVRNRTTVTDERIVARGLFGSTTLGWAEVKSLRLVRKGWLKAVRADDSEVTLPGVRLMHLPALSLISGGLVPDPSAKPAEEKTPEEQPAEEKPAEEEPEKAESAASAAESDESETPESVQSEK